MIRSYKVLKDRVLDGEVYAKEGETVYDCSGHDYGCASEESYLLGVSHISVTLDENGDYPFFTIPTSDLEMITA